MERRRMVERVLSIVGSRRMTKMFATQLHVLCPIAPLTVGSYV